MQNTGNLLQALKAKGHRFSYVRQTILDLLSKRNEPLSAADLQRLLARKKVLANKTTVYRELAFLRKEKIIRELRFGDNKKRYEIMPDNHHHHIVCVDCEKIEHVVLERDLDAEEKRITRSKNFKVLNHSLEFYGICRKCFVK